MLEWQDKVADCETAMVLPGLDEGKQLVPAQFGSDDKPTC